MSSNAAVILLAAYYVSFGAVALALALSGEPGYAVGALFVGGLCHPSFPVRGPK